MSERVRVRRRVSGATLGARTAAGPPAHTLMSRCSSCAECMYLSARKIWYMQYCLWISSRMLARTTACMSVSIYSNTR